MAHELEMTDAEFSIYQKWIYDVCGINLSLAKKQLLTSRLNKRMRVLKILTFRDYREFVQQDKSQQELIHMIDSISTNKTEFFREIDHYHFLEQQVYPELLQRHQVRIWSAGCSSGEEAYSIAMTILEHQSNVHHKDIKILATDISTRVLDSAEAGVYSSERIVGVPDALKRKYFLKGSNTWEGHFLVKDSLKNLIRFRRLNFMEKFPLSVQFDVIFCRNVMIYFDKPTQERLIEKFSNQLAPNGYLLIGHSESLSGIHTNLHYVQPTIYQK